MTVRAATRVILVLVLACALAGVVSGAGSAVARGQSAAVAVTAVTLPPVADAYVDASKPTTNFGTLATLRVDALSPVQRSFLRFDLSAVTGTVTSATLRVWAETSQATGYDVYGVADNTWGETTIKDNNAPALAPTRTGFSGKATAGSWTSVNVTSLVSTGHAVSFALKTTNSTALKMTSKEGTAANRPQLVVETVASSDTQAPTTPANVTATAFSPTRIDVAWSASSDDVGVTGYSIYKDGGTTPLSTVAGSTLALSDPNVNGGSTHSYTVDAFDAAGNHSPASSPPASATTPDAPGCTTSTNGTAYSVTVCLTAPASGPVSGAVPVSATASATSLNGSLLPSLRVRFCVDDSGCLDGASGYVLSDYASPYGFNLPSSNWVDGSHTLTARPWMGDSFLGQPTPVVSLTFGNGVTQVPGNGNTFTPTSGTAPGGGQPLVVAAVGDGAAGEANETSVVNEIAAWNPNLVLYLGDVYEKGSPSEFFNYYGATGYGLFKSITDPAVGNHEYGLDNQASGYFNFWDTNRHYYSFDAGGWHFISLDSTSQFNQAAPGTGQYTWLQGDLAADTSPCTLVYYHHPVYNVGPEGAFTDATRLAPIWSLLATHGGVLVLNGHDHDYQRWTPLDGSGNPNPNGLTEIVVGTGGHGHQPQVVSDPRLVMGDFTHFGALRLQLNATSADFSFIPTVGATVDTGNIPCNPAPVTPPPAPTLTLTPADANDSASGSTVFYNPNASSGSFTVGATATGATAVQFPNVFTGSDGVTDPSSPFAQTYNWTSGASTSGSFAVTASNTGGTSPQSQFTVTPDATAPSTSASCNLGSCAGPFSSFVSMSLASSDTGSGPAATYYTTDGTDPTTSVTRTLYTVPLLVPATETVRFYTLDNVGNAETPQSQTVTISSAGGVAYVQQKVGSGSAATLPVTLTSASVSGDTLVAVVALAAGSSASVTNVADSTGAQWTASPVVGFLTGTNSRVEIWYRLGAPSVTTVTVTLSASKALTVNVSEWSGVATASAPDGSAHTGTASSLTAATPLLPTNNATDLLIGAINYPANATATLASGPFTGLDFAASTSVHGRAAYQITSATGSYQASWTLSILSGGNGSAILALRAA